MFTFFRLAMNACRECLREPVFYLMLLAALSACGRKTTAQLKESLWKAYQTEKDRSSADQIDLFSSKKRNCFGSG